MAPHLPNGAYSDGGMVRSAIARNGVAVSTQFMDGLVAVQGDRAQLRQVVVNLILNAAEAMSSVEAGGRELLIRTEQIQTGDILVAVHDSGPGIDPGNLERVFEPFYTTKISGVGMGLSICQTIINGHGGRLWVSANEPRGRRISVHPARQIDNGLDVGPIRIHRVNTVAAQPCHP